jgi:hypothetical protein
LNELSADESAFVLSRIYSQGWNAAKKMLASGTQEIAELQADAVNPYRSGKQQSRWMKGFMEALASPVGSRGEAGRHLRHARSAKNTPAARVV